MKLEFLRLENLDANKEGGFFGRDEETAFRIGDIENHVVTGKC